MGGKTAKAWGLLDPSYTSIADVLESVKAFSIQPLFIIPHLK